MRKKGRKGILNQDLAAAEKLFRRYILERNRLGREIAKTNGKTALGKRQRYGLLEHSLVPQARQRLQEVRLLSAKLRKPQAQ